MLPVSHLLRLARRLARTWAARMPSTANDSPGWQALVNHFDAVQHHRRLLHRAASRHLSQARSQLTRDLGHYLGQLARQAELLLEAQDTPAVRAPDRCDWIREIRQLETEFGTVAVRWTDAVLRVVTEPIVLRRVPLGPFAIDFHWDRDRHLLGAASFEVVALKPHPPAGRDDVTHPHVRDGLLCAGDATAPLKRAVAEGRLVDAFLLVRAVLLHYNPRSPHVPLSEWDGFACADCQSRGDRDERYSCEGCDCDLCGACALSCAACPATRCADCLTPCDRCLARHCPGCLTSDDRDRALCSDCRAGSEEEESVQDSAPDSPEPEEDEADHDPQSVETEGSEQAV
jgi:hypothetical protein